MFWKKPEVPTREQLLIDICHDELAKYTVGSEEFNDIVNSMNLVKAGIPKKDNQLNVNTLLTVGAYVFVTLTVVAVEVFGHSITSRSLNALPFKPRL